MSGPNPAQPPPEGSARFPRGTPGSGTFPHAPGSGRYTPPGSGPYPAPGAHFTPASGRYPGPSEEDLRRTLPDGPHRTPRADVTPFPSGAGTPPTSGGYPAASGARRPLPPQVTERFEVLDELGRGGMGVVYLVHDRQSRERLALKVLIGQLNLKRLRRLEREAQATQTLDHPGIVPLLDASLDPAAPWLAYRLIRDARTLSDAMDSLPLPRRLQVVIDVARAAGHAHARGVVHRDLKAENVLLDPADRAYLTDFGVAALAGADRLTRSGAMVGTPHAMAPEQLKGERDKIGPRTDVWALGVLLYHALTDHEPFTGQTLGDLGKAIRSETPPPPRHYRPELVPELDEICRRCLEKEPPRRYTDGEAVAAALESLLERAIYRTSAARWPWALAAGAACGLLAFGLGRLSAPAPRQVTQAASPSSSPTAPATTPTPASSPALTPAASPAAIPASTPAAPVDPAQLSLEELERRVAGGAAELRVVLARRLLDGGPTQDPRRAASLLEVAVRDEVPGARLALARLLSYGWGIGRQRGRARDLLLAAASETPVAWLDVAHLHAIKSFGPGQATQTKVYLQRAHEAGVPGAARILGWAEGGARGAELIRGAAEAGDPLAFLALSALYRKGVGVEQDSAEAQRWRARFGEAVNGELDSETLFALAMRLHLGIGAPKNVVIPRQILGKLVQRGFAPAMFELATCTGTGCGGERDPKAARKLALSAAAAQLYPAQVKVARAAMARRDYARARELLAAPFQAGSLSAAALLGSLHYDGQGGPRDHAEARRILETGRESWNRECLRNLAMMLERGHGGPQDVDAALELYARSARLGHPLAARQLATIYSAGLHGRKDLERAREFARLGSRLKDSACDVILGKLVGSGQGVPPAEGLEALSRAMKRGHLPAHHVFAALHLDDSGGVPQDYERARRALEVPAVAGYPPAILDLSKMLVAGHGGPRDLERAERLLRRAAKISTPAKRQLGLYLLAGVFPSTDPQEGRSWLEKAAANGDEQAKRELAKLPPK